MLFGDSDVIFLSLVLSYLEPGLPSEDVRVWWWPFQADRELRVRDAPMDVPSVL